MEGVSSSLVVTSLVARVTARDMMSWWEMDRSARAWMEDGGMPWRKMPRVSSLRAIRTGWEVGGGSWSISLDDGRSWFVEVKLGAQIP